MPHLKNWLLCTHCRCRGLLLQPITLCDTNTYTRYDSSEREIGRRRDLWLHTTFKRDTQSRPSRDSNPQSQQASSRKPTP